MMDKDYFMNAGIPPPHFGGTAAAPPWTSLNSTAEQSFLDHPSCSSIDQFSQFEPAFNSVPSSSSPGDSFVLRELIGKLGSIGSSTSFPPATAAVSPFPGSNSNNGQINMPNLNPITPPLASVAGDPGFAERAAKFSCFGSRSFNGRNCELGLNNGELGHRSGNLLMGNGKLPRVSSTPLLKQVENKNLTENGKNLISNSNEESSVSDQIIPSGETASKTSNDLNSKKRKSLPRPKTTPIKGDEDGNNPKRSKPQENGKNETKNEDEKPPEPPKDYIHVRARRGQATDSHSLAERVRREKISERMKLLQDLVPGCNKVTGKALMLDEIINYVQSLQRQVEFLSMKLSSVNPSMDFNMENLLSKDMFQQNGTLPQQMYPLDSSSPPFYHQNTQENNNNNNSNSNNNNNTNLPVGIQLPSVDGFTESLHQFSSFSEDDLHSIVQMGFVNFPVSNSTANMKVEP